ncbi:hypothetical protein [Mesorhizobium sp. SP-1A]|uniref:hypothetical protein n=1 Tax=Mesorhizobium sp. SP-1A TaxID=3077840 RepID=UPI0028F73981|nr:hypothetical protein [Mesorhizobium sp. SP-1A]
MKNLTMNGFQRTLAAACSVLGLPAEAVQINGSALLIPSENIAITPELSGNTRVWLVTTTFKVGSIDGLTDREITNVLFEEPLNDIWAVARRVALYLAERNINIAIENSL